MRICVDFDATIQLWGTPLPGAIETLSLWQDRGDEILIYTSRQQSDFPAIFEWLQGYGITPIGILSKPYADLYIDDKAINPSIGWDAIREAVG